MKKHIEYIKIIVVILLFTSLSALIHIGFHRYLDMSNPVFDYLATFTITGIISFPLFYNILCHIEKLKSTKEEIKNNEERQKVISHILLTLLQTTDYQPAFMNALEILGKALKVDRVFIFKNHETDHAGQRFTSRKFEWISEGIQHNTQRLLSRKISYHAAGFDRWYKLLSSKNVVEGHVDDFPAEEKEALEYLEIKSLLVIPMVIEDEFWGFIGFGDCTEKRVWSTVEKSALSLAAASFGAAFARMELEVVAQKNAAAQVKYMTYYDQLTDLPNRFLFMERLGISLSHAQHSEHMVGLMMLDIDRFKTINDSLGHVVGDLLLQEVAERLKECVNEGDILARLGGDEFALLFKEISNEEELAKVASKILKCFSKPFKIEDTELYITASIGISVSPVDGQRGEVLIRNCDTAMYRAKELGRNNYQFYTLAMNQRDLKRLSLENYLRKALDKQEFILYYQPQVDLKTGSIIGFEALIRWKHPELGMVSPGDFIPLAEETGLIIPIGEWVLKTACEQSKTWQDAGYPPLRVAVNLSSIQFDQQDLVEKVNNIIQATGLDPKYLELEITENATMKNTERTIAILHHFKNEKIQISIDDFGTGFSSLSYLKYFTADILKIDKSFIRDVADNSTDAAIAKAIISMAHSLHLKVIAEGVETEQQLAFLISNRCDEMQGYLFSRPLPADEFEKLLITKKKLFDI